MQNPEGGRHGPTYYQIRVRGALDPSWSEWFGDLAITHDADGDSTLIGPVTDQTALYGLLARARDLGLTLLAVQQGEPQGDEGRERRP